MTNKPLVTSGQDWTFDLIEEVYGHIDRIAREKYRLNFYPNQLEIITSEQMLDAYCVTPDHKVLREDLRWVPAGQVREGDTLLGFDEEGPQRSYKKAKVSRVEHTTAPVFAVELSSGHVFKVTEDHLWLVRQQKGNASTLLWRKTSQLRGENDPSGHPPSRIPKVMDTWTEDQSKDAGWIAGMYDGEGNILKGSVGKLSIAQREGIVLDRLKDLLIERDILFGVYDKWESDTKTLDILGQVKDKLKFLGTYRPERLISKLDFDALGLMKTPNWEEVVSITSLGESSIVKITTSSGTFVCDGYPMHNCSVGMPISYAHWTFGEAFIKQLEQYKRGYVGLAYEIVINSDPCIAYLMEENTMLMQTLVIAHASFGHNHFFKNNYLFKQWTDAEAIIDYLSFAKKFIRDCEERYGIDEVEAVLDAAHALQHHGVDKYKRPPRLSAAEEEKLRKERDAYIQSQVNEIWNTIPTTKGKDDKEKPECFPCEPQENLLYFIEKNAPRLEDWKREIIRIVRKMGQYFYPQMQTKVMNEGCATYVHYKIMHDLHDEGIVDESAMFEFYQSHTGVVFQPDFDSKYFSGINPYALGFAMMRDIERIATDPTDEDREWFSGQDWVGSGDYVGALQHAWANYKDESFIQQYLSPKVIRDLKLFAIHDDEDDPKLEVSGIHNKQGYKRVRADLSAQNNIGYMIPDIQVVDVDRWGDRTMTLHHYMIDNRPLNPEQTVDTLTHLAFLWGYNVRLESIGTDGKTKAVFDMQDSEVLMDMFLDD